MVEIMALGVSTLALGVAAFNAHIIIRGRLDLEKFKNELMLLLNGKYMARREVDLLLEERDRWRAEISRRLEAIEK